MSRKWSEMTTTEKVATIISAIALCVWLVFEVVERKTSIGFAKYVNYIAICVICICEAISFWKVRRSLSYIAVAGAILMIAVIILTAMLLA